MPSESMSGAPHYPDGPREGGLKEGLSGYVPVSTVIPCYRCSQTIGRALASIANQTVLPREVVLVEDASPDDGKTLDALRQLTDEYGDVFEIKIIALKENAGAGSARNRGWEAATQPYIAFLDADDTWHPRKLEIQYGWMDAHPAFGLVGHALAQAQVGHKWRHLMSETRIRSVTKASALFFNPFSTPTVMLKRDLPYRFEERKRYAEDYLLWLEIILSGTRVAVLEHPLAAIYKENYGEAGLSSHLWSMEKGELELYRALYRGGKIGLAAAAFFSVYSFTKYLRRVLRVLTRKRICH